MKTGIKLSVIYPSHSDQKPFDTAFYDLLHFLKANAVSCEWVNLNVDTEDSEAIINTVNKIKNNIIYIYLPDIILISRLKDYLPVLRKNNRLLALGGEPAVTIKAKELLEEFAPADLVIGEPENETCLANLIKQIERHGEWCTMPGITFREDGNSRSVTVNSNGPMPETIDHLSSLGPFEQGIDGFEWYPVTTSRGCGYNCQYCGYQIPYRTGFVPESSYWRPKDESQLVDEIEFLQSKGYDKFTFRCNQFFQPDSAAFSRAEALAAEIIRRKLKLKFRFSAKPAEIRKNFDKLFLLKEAGLEEINVGLDSAIPRFFEMYQSGSGVEDSVEVLEFLNRYDFRFDVGFIFYDPFLTIPEMQLNVQFLKKIEPYFSHQEKPYSTFLDTRFLVNTLFLRYGMPINQRLREQNLLVEYPSFSAHPVAKFKDPAVMYVYSIYRTAHSRFLPPFRAIYSDRAMAERYELLNLFPLHVLEEIVNTVEEKKFPEYKEYVLHIESYIKEKLSLLENTPNNAR